LPPRAQKSVIFIKQVFLARLVTYLVLQHYRRSDIVYLSDPHHGVTSRYIIEKGVLQLDRHILRCGLAGGRYTPRTSSTDESLRLTWRTPRGNTVETRGRFHTEHLRELSRRNLVLAPQLFLDFYLTLFSAFARAHEYRRYTGKPLWPPPAYALPEQAGSESAGGGVLGAGIVEDFLANCEHVVVDWGMRVKRAVLYEVFREWCRINSLKPLPRAAFYSVLRSDPRFEELRLGGTVWIKGIGLRKAREPIDWFLEALRARGVSVD